MLRYVQPPGALPVTIAEERDLPALYLPAGTRGRWPTVDGRTIRDAPLERRFVPSWDTEEREWTGSDVLILPEVGAAHSVWLFWTPPERRFAGWYVNLEAPWRPTTLGFETRDHTLDLWVEPDRTWSWKDEDELEVALAVGHYSDAEAAAIRAEGERVVERIEAWSSPFCDDWEEWGPDPDWPIPELPPDWEAP